MVEFHSMPFQISSLEMEQQNRYTSDIQKLWSCLTARGDIVHPCLFDFDLVEVMQNSSHVCDKCDCSPCIFHGCCVFRSIIMEARSDSILVIMNLEIVQVKTRN